ncbi:HU family DNA-binding protein [Castellaniella sp.]|uniref:HU family DNA-binding protein n=1 Tax=Castellaniella sp. TaxID=1955812 RepID=UPI002AFEB608|nr:HU family DNA-binding protein [Castellaniella sp.]
MANATDRNQLAQYIASVHDLTKAKSLEIVNDLFEQIKSEIADGNDVSIHAFGKFSAKARAARTARNPGTGETIQVAAKTAVTFKPAKQFKDEVNS